jgi:hypothetical protein
MSTHPLESFFDFLQRFPYDCNKYQALVQAAAKNMVLHKAYHELGHPFEICNRVNTSGVVGRTTGGESLRTEHIIPQFFKEFMDMASASVAVWQDPSLPCRGMACSFRTRFFDQTNRKMGRCSRANNIKFQDYVVVGSRKEGRKEKEPSE